MDYKRWKAGADFRVEIDESLLDNRYKSEPFATRVTEQFKYQFIQYFYKSDSSKDLSDAIREACEKYLEINDARITPNAQSNKSNDTKFPAEISDYTNHDFTKEIVDSEFLVIETSRFHDFIKTGSHLSALQYRFRNKIGITHIFLSHRADPGDHILFLRAPQNIFMYSRQIRFGLAELFSRLNWGTTDVEDYSRHVGEKIFFKLYLHQRGQLHNDRPDPNSGSDFFLANERNAYSLLEKDLMLSNRIYCSLCDKQLIESWARDRWLDIVQRKRNTKRGAYEPLNLSYDDIFLKWLNNPKAFDELLYNV